MLSELADSLEHGRPVIPGLGRGASFVMAKS